MKKILLLLGCLFCIISAEAGEMLPLGSNAEKIEFAKWVHKEPVTLSQFKDKKVVVLFFWTIDSESLMAFRPISELCNKVEKDKVAWIGIASGDVKKIEDFKLTKTLPFPVAADNGKTVEKYLPSKAKYPACAIISKDGRLAWRGSVRNMPAVLKRLLAGKLDINEIARKEKFNISLGRAVKEKKHKEAIALIESEQKLKFSPDLATLHLQMLLEMKDTAGAVDMLNKTVEDHPQFIGPHLLRLMMHRSYFKNEKDAWKYGIDSIEKLKAYPAVLTDLLANEVSISFDQRSPAFMLAAAEALKGNISKIKKANDQATALLIYAQAMNLCAFNSEAAAAAEQAEKLFSDERSKSNAKKQKEYYKKIVDLKNCQKLKK